MHKSERLTKTFESFVFSGQAGVYPPVCHIDQHHSRSSYIFYFPFLPFSVDCQQFCKCAYVCCTLAQWGGAREPREQHFLVSRERRSGGQSPVSRHCDPPCHQWPCQCQCEPAKTNHQHDRGQRGGDEQFLRLSYLLFSDINSIFL